ncbi:carbon-nitrogen hydrolase family protein [Denitrobaculum tricleocarpae]|uniref:Carbon-nitrogen hydrolase family protein n=1 Tax=Denitrobaculum tricleocarpae TaxID=2591009 RepID=A0A545TXX2_9PROT|nr:carbon-nitrogen hydrolase family protein [Denitrobaculum tricleocarpae]TQV82057.1 carbon-nitrogen hydrolase family protein [Denitrobaculum tricleocarpae]
MKLALYQGPSPAGDPDAAFTAIEGKLLVSAAAGADMVVFPELFLPGYNQPQLHASLAQPQGGPWAARLSALAKSANCGLTIGWAEREGKHLYNSASVFDARGQRLAHYRKLQLYGEMERSVFVPGSDYVLFQLGGVRGGLLICYDVEFAQHCRALRELGAELLLVPTANPSGFEHVQDILLPARALETNMTIAYANYCGQDGELSFGGRSLLVGPDGNDLASAGHSETLLITDLNDNSDIDPLRVSAQLKDFREASGTHDQL